MTGRAGERGGLSMSQPATKHRPTDVLITMPSEVLTIGAEMMPRKSNLKPILTQASL